MEEDETRYRWPVEAKVKAGAGAAVVTAFVVWLLGRYVFRGVVPAEVVDLVALAVPGLAALVGGYLAPHTPR